VETKLKKAMRNRGIMQRFIANKTGLHESIISLVINGKRKPNERYKRLITKAMGCDIKELF